MLRNLILPASFQSKACRVCRSCRICRGCRICRNCRGCQVCRSCRGFLSQPGLPDFSCSSPDKRKCLPAAFHLRDAKNKLRPRQKEMLAGRVSPQRCEKQALTPTRGNASWPPFHLRDAKNKLWPRQEEMLVGRRFASDLRKTCSGPDNRKCLLAAVSPQICEKHALAPTGGNACWPPFHLRFAKNKLWPR